MPLRKLNIRAAPRTDGRPDYPKFQPIHPDFVGRGTVLSVPAHRAKNVDGPKYYVDLGAGTCTCKYGEPFSWHQDKSKWVTSQYCSHKIRMMATILEETIQKHATDGFLLFPSELQRKYAQAVGSRYNKYEVVSAFHKELRRGSVEQAIFWGHMLANTRGVKGVLKYLLNIVYEETRDHWLARWLLNANRDVPADPNQYYITMLYAIKLFCQSPKKWELPHRMKYLEAEMRGYEKLIQEFGRDVAKGGNIISVKHRDKLFAALKLGLLNQDAAQTQYGLKGLQKLCAADIDAHRAWIINTLDEDRKLMALFNSLGTGPEEHATLIKFISNRAGTGYGIGYHELNMLVDHWLGEPYTFHANGAVLADFPPRLKLGVAPNIPIYAQDNHTWAGKALLRRFPEEWQPGAIQKNYDLRLCGAYMGVIWRHLAFKQFGRIDCDWGEVKWPKWLSNTAANLWY